MSITAETNGPVSGMLVVGRLTIESSYTQNLERSATNVPDTVQFWISETNLWRVRTFAVDHDIHVHSIAKSGPVGADPETFAISHLKKNYGEVLSDIFVFRFGNTSNSATPAERFSEHSLDGSLERAKSGFAFWNPDNAKYQSQSRPQ